MIQREKMQRGKIDANFVRLAITGKVDDILQHYKTPIELKNIFNTLDPTDEQKLVLIEGAPGSGKSTLALHICQEWAKGKLFQEYDVVVLVRLRDPLIKNAKKVSDILPCVDKAMAEDTEAAMKAQYGNGVLWVFDGWDELPNDLPFDCIVNKLVQPDLSLESPLPKCAFIVTSRPSASAELHKYVSLRVEVLGFTPDELEQYFSECLKGDSGAVQTLLDRIRENPVVEGSCYLPLNASIIAHVFLSGDHSLPTSNHEIFTSEVRFSLSRYMQDRLYVPCDQAVIKTLYELPMPIRDLFTQLCKLAYFGVVENKITFVGDDLASAGISSKVCDVGLLQTVPTILVNSRESYYNFLHLSIQELLAAIRISRMSVTDQMSVFRELFGNPRFSAVFQFYAGITKLKVNRPILSKIPKFVFPNTPRGMRDIVSDIVRNDNKSQIVSLLHCLYEAEDLSLCELIANLLGNTLDLTTITLSPLDCLSIGYFLSVVCITISDVFTVYLNSCSVGDQGCKLLTRGIRKCLHSHSKLTTPLDLHLSNNNIHGDGIRHISALLKDTNLVHKLDLSRNNLKGNDLKNLCEALSANVTLETLCLRFCALTITSENGLFLCQLLESTNTSLSNLDLSDNHIADCSPLATGLYKNRSLKAINLSACSLTDKNVEHLSTGLNNDNIIEELDISYNDALTINGLKNLGKRLRTVLGLRHLKIPKHLRSSIGTVFTEVNEERWRNGLPEIKVDGKWAFVNQIILL